MEINNKVSFSRYIVMKPYCPLPAVMAGLIGFIQKTFSSLLLDLKMEDDAKLVNTSIITNTILTCQIIGSLLVLRIYKIWGPKVALLLSDIICIIICFLILRSFPVMSALWIGTVFFGIAMGLMFVAAPIFCFQSSPHQVREGLMIIVGITK